MPPAEGQHDLPVSLALVVEAARLAQRPTSSRHLPTRLPTVGGHGLLPGVDLDDSAAPRELG